MKTKKISHTNVIIDKVSFTIPILKSQRPKVLDRINNPTFYSDCSKKVFKNNKGRYKNDYQFTIADDCIISVNMYPINTQQNFLRLEYNPAKMDPKTKVKLRRFLLDLLALKTVKFIYYEANVTRIDLAIDIKGLNSQIYIYKPRFKESALERSESDENVIASQIIGSSNSDMRSILYNTTLPRAGQIVLTQYKGEYRLESRMRLRKARLCNLNNKLLKELTEHYFYNHQFLSDTKFDAGFIEAAKKSGLCHAMYHLSDNNRRRYRRYLEFYRVHPIDWKKLDFDQAHYRAFTSLVHPSFKDKELVAANKSLLRGGVSSYKRAIMVSKAA